MRIWKVVFIMVLLMFLLTTCKQPTDEELYYKTHKKLGEMESYRCRAKIYTRSGGTEKEYVFLQTFKYPNQYRLEIISPENLKGNLTISNGKTAWLVNPSINHISKLESFNQSQERMMFIGYFMQNFMKSERTEITREQLNGNWYIVVTTPLPLGNYYFDKQKLWIDIKEMVPVQMHVLDQKGNVRFRVAYEDFEYNPKLEDSLFYIQVGEE